MKYFYLIFISFLFVVKLYGQTFISSEENVLLLMEPKLHAKRILLKPEQGSFNGQKDSKSPILKIKPYTKDTVGGRIYYFVEVKLSEEGRDWHFGFLEKNDLSKTQLASIDSSLLLANNYAFTIVSKKRGCLRPVFNGQNSIPESQLYGLNEYSLNNDFYIFKEPGRYNIPKIKKELTLQSGRMLVLNINYKKNCKVKNSELLTLNKYYSAMAIDTVPPENRLMNGNNKYRERYWSGKFIDGLANGYGELLIQDFEKPKYLLYKGNLLDDLFNGNGTCFGCSEDLIQTGQWQYGEFVNGKMYCKEINLDTAGNIKNVIYGNYLLDTKFTRDSKGYSNTVNDTLYENFLVKDTLYPKHLLANGEINIPVEDSIISSIVKHSFYIYYEALRESSSKKVSSIFTKQDTYNKSGSFHIARDIFIVCSNTTKLIYLQRDYERKPLHRFIFTNLKHETIVAFDSKNDFVENLKKACGCK